jgi:hypothetical protein
MAGSSNGCDQGAAMKLFHTAIIRRMVDRLEREDDPERIEGLLITLRAVIDAEKENIRLVMFAQNFPAVLANLRTVNAA